MVLEQKGADSALSILTNDSQQNCDKFLQIGGIAHRVYGKKDVLNVLGEF